METAIYDILTNTASVTDIVSTRIYPSRIPQGETLPAVTFQRIGNEPEDDKDGPSTLDVITLDIDMFGKSLADLKTLSGAIRTALDRFSGTRVGIIINSIQFVTDRDLYENSKEIYHINQEYSIRQIR
jgi:hypothetical protein